jgi:hypothetical protein
MITRDPASDDRARRIAEAKIREVITAHAYADEITFLLAVGAACPFGGHRDKEIWLEELSRLAEKAGA